MISQTNLKIILAFLSAIIVFIYAIDSFSKEITNANQIALKKIMSRLAKNRISATIIGALSTAIVHSSSAISSITVLFVSMGYLSFKTSLGLIFGANIGTTLTAQLALIDSSLIAPILIVTGFIIGLFGKKLKIISKSVFFLGFILFSLNLLSESISPLQNNPEIISFFSYLDSIPIALIVSASFTMLVQSSSITTGILIVLANSGLIELNIAIAMILGANIGSSTTAMIISNNLDVYAKKTALANVIFNVIGSLIWLILLPPFSNIINTFSNNIAQQTALAHLTFNVFNTILFLIILTPFANLIDTLIKSDEEEISFETKYLKNLKTTESNKILKAIKKELMYTVNVTAKLFEASISLNKEYSNPKKLYVIKLETLNDYLDDEISNTLISLSNRKLSEKYAKKIIRYIKISNTLEQIGDLGKDYAELFIKLHNDLNKQNIFNVTSLYKVHTETIHILKGINKLIENPSHKNIQSQRTLEKNVEKEILNVLKKYIKTISEKGSYDSSYFVDALSILELVIAKSRLIRKVVEE